MPHTAESPVRVAARNRAQETCQSGKLTIADILARVEARNRVNALARPETAAYAGRLLGRRFCLSSRRARLVAELAGLAVRA